jgi:hypothetical protein
VQELPASCDAKSAGALIEAAVGLNKGCSDIRVHSLANDPCYGGKKTATVTSKDLTCVLPEATQRDNWEFDLPGELVSSHFDSHEAPAIVIDTHFEGFTPLNSFDDSGQHRYEYVLSLYKG